MKKVFWNASRVEARWNKQEGLASNPRVSYYMFVSPPDITRSSFSSRSNFNCSSCPVLLVLFKYDQVNKLKLGCISTTALVLVVCRCDRKVVWLVSYLLYGVIKSCMVVWPVGCMVRWRKVTPDKLPHSSDWQNTKKNYTRQFVTTHSIIYMSLPKLRTLPLNVCIVLT